MSVPLFQEAISNEPYRAPDYDRVDAEQELVDGGRWRAPMTYYEPAPVDREEEDAIRADMIDNNIPVTSGNLGHAIQAEEIRKFLRHYGLDSTRKVAATRDHRGMVKLTFTEFRELVERMLNDENGESL